MKYIFFFLLFSINVFASDDDDLYFFFDGNGKKTEISKKDKAKNILRPHDHDDLFGEQEVLFGFRLGPQISGYTSYKVGTGEVSVQSSFRGAGGLASEFIYEWFRLELDLFWSARGKITNEGNDLHSFAFPILAKLPLHLSEFIDIEAGLGFQADIPFAGFEPRRNILVSGVGALGLLADLNGTLFTFESRYVMGIQNVSSELNGATPREFQVLLGFLWHY